MRFLDNLPFWASAIRTIIRRTS